jgi:penicillin-binding protein 2
MDKYLDNKIIKNHFANEVEPHEVLLDKLAQRKEKELGLSENKFETPLMKVILYGFFIIIVALLSSLFIRTFQLQVFKNKDFLAQAEENKYIFYQIRAERGVIYDKDLKQLVFNQPSFDLFLDKSKLPQSEQEKFQVLKEVSQILNMDLKDLENKMQESSDIILEITKDLDHQTLIILETKVKELPGFWVENKSKREYLNSEGLAHILGYLGKIKTEEMSSQINGAYNILDYVGRSGLESYYEETLRKNSGKLQIEKDVRGNVISKETVSLPEPGKSLVLYLDSSLQGKIKEELERKLKDVGSVHGAAVALDPKTGGVLALVSLPSFDSNAFSQGNQEEIGKILKDKKEPLFNLALSGLFPTGSTIKPFIASAALEEKIISPEKKIYSPGYIEVPNRYDPEIVYKFLDQAPPNWYDIRRAIAFSSNVYFYTIGGGFGGQEGLGPTRIKKYLELFGWGSKTGIDLPGEARGLIPSPEWKKNVKNEGWWDGDTYNMAIGQGNILATPLQVASAFVVIANGGKLFQPEVVQKVINSSASSPDSSASSLIEEIQPKIIRENFIKPENLQAVKEGMRQAVTGGGSVILNDLPVKVAAKTGTAETSKENVYHNWVTVFAPYDDPQIVLTVMLEDVKGVQAAALPVAKEVLNWYFSK